MTNKYENIPNKMKEEALFCTHYKKTPTNKTKPNDKSTFYSFNKVMEIKQDFEGIGIGLFDSYCGIDIDHCIDDKGNPSEVAKDIVKTIKSYTEKSLSGTGLHIIFKCENQEEIDSMKYYTKMNEKQCLENGIEGTGGLEIYQGNFDNRYLTLTGNIYYLKELQTIDFKIIKGIIEKYMKKPQIYNKPSESINYTTTPTNDREYLNIGLKKDDKLIELWNSTPSGSGGNESETDLSLMNKLAYWTNKNESLMKQAFEESNYYQQKDSLHQKKWQREDYQSTTIQKAIAMTNKTAIEQEKEFQMKLKASQCIDKVLSDEEPKQDSLQDNLIEANALNQIQSFFDKVDSEIFKPIPTGMTKLDEALSGGLSMQSLVLLGGMTSVGKTTFTLNLVTNLAKQRPIVYFTLEMSEEQILSKIYSHLAYTGGGMTISSTNILQSYDKNKMTDYQRSKLIEELNKHTELSNIIVKFPEKATIDYLMQEINAMTKQFKEQGQEAPIIVIDYLQFIQGNAREDSQNLIKRIQRLLKKYAIEENTFVILLFANSRKANETKESAIDSGRDTSDIEYSSDYNLQLNFYEYEHEGSTCKKSVKELSSINPKRMTLTIHKQRFGQRGKMIDFTFNGINNTFEAIDQSKDNSFIYNHKKTTNILN